MARYIDGERLRNHVALYMAENAYINDTALDVLKMVSEWINEAPTVDAEPVRHGHWIDEYDGKCANPRYICSNCKGKALYDFVRDELGNWKEVQALTDFCPHCGAIMGRCSNVRITN